MSKSITVVFEPDVDEPVWYKVNGITASGASIGIASGWASGTVRIPVSGFENYTLGVSAPASGLPGPSNLTTDTTVTVVFGSQQDFYVILWAIFSYIGTHWQNTKQCDMPEAQFQKAIDWQVELEPSYAVYYAAAVAEYTRLLQETGDPQAALSILFSENTSDDPKLPDVQKYVLGEFMRWQVAFGGFRAFGPPYENYSGWMGGGSFEANPPPYRALAKDE